MTTLTLSPDPAYGRMRVVVMGAAGGTLVRDGVPVRGGAGLTGDLVVNDYECPIGVPVTYWLEGQPGGTTDQPVDIGGDPPTSAKWGTSWSKWAPTWQAGGVTLTHDRDGEGVLLSTTVIPVVPGQRYRLSVAGTGLTVTPATATLFDVMLSTDMTPDFFDSQSVGIRSGTKAVPVGAHSHEWELPIPATITPSSGVGAPQTMKVAIRLRPTMPLGDTVTITTITATRLAVRAEQVTGQLDADTPWLSHPTRPELSQPARVVDDTSIEWSAPGVAHVLVGAEEPLWTHSTRSLHSGQVEILTDWDSRAAMRALLADGSALLLRTPPGCFLDDQWMAVERVTRRKDRPYDPVHLHWTLQYTRVKTPGGQVQFDPSNSWDAVPVTHDTWADLVADHATWTDVLLAEHPHQATAGQ